MNVDWGSLVEYAPLLAEGVLVTVLVCVTAYLLVPLLGMAVAFGALSSRKAIRYAATGYVEVIRNTPFLVQAFLVFYGLPLLGMKLEPLTTGIAVLTLYGGAYFAEATRAAYNAVPKGQFEVSSALGLEGWVRFRRVVLPQMLGFLLPQAGNLSIVMLKESAVLSVITVPELAYATQQAVTRTYSFFEFYILIALIYWGLSSALARGFTIAERATARHRR